MVARKRSSSRKPSSSRKTPSEDSSIKFVGVAREVPASAEDDLGALHELRLAELRDLCRDRSLAVSGRKADLIARLLESMGVPPEPAVEKEKLYPSVAISDAFNTGCHGAAAVLALRSASPGGEVACTGFALVAVASLVGTLRFGFSSKLFAPANEALADLAAFVGLP